MTEIAANICPCCGEPSKTGTGCGGWECNNEFCDVRTFRNRNLKNAAPLQFRWLASWYATRLHAALADFKHTDGTQELRSICGQYVYEEPRTEWARRFIAAGPPRCKHCEEIVAAQTPCQPPPDKAQ